MTAKAKKQTSESKNVDWLDEADDGLVIRLQEGANAVTFLRNYALRKPHPAAADPDQLQWAFAVNCNGEVGELFTRSKRFLAQLKPHAPLEGKVFEITRTGRGIKTTYAVKDTGEIERDLQCQTQLPGAWFE